MEGKSKASCTEIQSRCLLANISTAAHGQERTCLFSMGAQTRVIMIFSGIDYTGHDKILV
jgi:hypothetical protein